MDGAKAAVGTVELHTGVRLEDGNIAKQILFRDLAGPEEDVLAAQNMPVSLKITTVLANCTQEFGTAKDPSAIRAMIDRLVITDRWNYLVQLRAHSLGSAYKFKSTCPACKSPDDVVIDLRELKVKDAPHAENLFHETPLPSGKKVRWKVADSLIEAKIEKMAKPDNAATIALFVRCDQIDNRPVTLADVKALPMSDRQALRKAIDAAEGDFDDSFDATCPKCGNEYQGSVKLDAQSFFFP